MDDLENPTTETAETVEGGEAPETSTSVEETPQGNPAWEGIRSQLDPISYSRIEPELKKFDQGVESRIQSVNEQLKPWKPFIEQNVQPDLVQAALTLQQSLDSNPAEIYQYLGDFLQKTGRMPTQTEVAAAEESGEIGEEQPESNPELEQIRQQQEQIRQFLEAQQQAELERQADADVAAEIQTFSEAHKDLSPDDVKEILARAAFEAQQNFAAGKGEIPTLESVYAGWFSGLRNRILSTPRSVDSAPRLLPTSGGVPSGQKPPSLGAMSNQDIQSIIANGLSQTGR